jgi:hypothetical protein
LEAGAVAAAIEPWDVAGLSDLSRRNFYTVNLDDLWRSRSKVGASEADIENLLRKLGLGTLPPARA